MKPHFYENSIHWNIFIKPFYLLFESYFCSHYPVTKIQSQFIYISILYSYNAALKKLHVYLRPDDKSMSRRVPFVSQSLETSRYRKITMKSKRVPFMENAQSIQFGKANKASLSRAAPSVTEIVADDPTWFAEITRHNT